MNITLNQLRAFVAVARERSFTRAAETLATSQPSISLLIKQLETALGLKLFDRTTKELHLTAEAANFLPTIERLNEDLDAALQDLLATAERRRGRVSLAVLPSIATNVLPDTVASFAAKYPNIRISVRDDNTKAICQQVRNGEVDLGVAGHVEGDADLMFEPLLRDPFGMVAHPEHELAQTTGPVAWSELAEYQFISFGLDTGLRPLFETVRERPENIRKPLIEAANIGPVLAMLRANIGIGALPHLALAKDENGLVFRTLVDPPLFREIALVTRPNRSLSPAAEAFSEHLKDVLKPRWEL